MAAKEESVQRTEGQETCEATQVAKTLNNAIKGGGLTILVEGQDQRIVTGGEVTKVNVSDVWAYFTVGDSGFRTSSKAGRDALLEGSVTTINCIQLSGPKPAPVEVHEPQKPKGFMPRSSWTRHVPSTML